MLALGPKIAEALLSKTKQLKQEEDGQAMIEYTMMMVLVALSVFIASPSMTESIVSVFTNTSSLLTEAMS